MSAIASSALNSLQQLVSRWTIALVIATFSINQNMYILVAFAWFQPNSIVFAQLNILIHIPHILNCYIARWQLGMVHLHVSHPSFFVAHCVVLWLLFTDSIVTIIVSHHTVYTKFPSCLITLLFKSFFDIWFHNLWNVLPVATNCTMSKLPQTLNPLFTGFLGMYCLSENWPLNGTIASSTAFCM